MSTTASSTPLTAGDVEPTSITESTYQSLDYLSPQGLQAASWLYGMQTPDLSTARVLELGCGDGTNLIPFVLANPQAQGMGVDLDADKVEQGMRWVSEIRADNLQLYSMDLPALLNSDPGTFDYIILRGVFSLVSGEGRSALLAFCRRHLSPDGVVCFGYNTYPGWKSAEVLQDAISLHTGQAKTPEALNASARAMLIYMSLGTATDNPQRESLQAFIKQAEEFNDVDLALHYYQGLNQPCYLVDFHTQATEAGLAYLGDAQPCTELAGHYSDNVAQLHQTICPYDHKLLKQQYLDFAVARKHRYSLLVAGERASDILPAPDLSRLADLQWAGNFRRYSKENVGFGDGHLLPDGATIFATRDTLALNLMDVMGDAWPNSVTLDQLVYNTVPPEVETWDQHKEAVLKSLRGLFIKSVVGLHVCLGDSTYNRQSSHSLALLPGVLSHYRFLTEGGNAFRHINFWHEARNIKLSAEEYAQLIIISQNSKGNSDGYHVLMEKLRSWGMLWGRPGAWRRYFQQKIAVCESPIDALKDIGSLILYSTSVKDGGILSNKEADTFLVGLVPLAAKHVQQLNELVKKGDFAEACALAQALVAQQPANASAWHLLAKTRVDTGDMVEALRALVKALSLHSGSWDYYIALVKILVNINQRYYADRLVRKILRCNPKSIIAWDALSVLYAKSSNFKYAEACSRKILAIIPNSQSTLSNLASFLDNQGKKAEALACYKKMVELDPEGFAMHSNMLFSLTHSDTVSPDILFQAHRRYGNVVEKRVRKYNKKFQYKGSKDPQRLLRVGFVSADLNDHPVAYFLEPIWRTLDSEHFSLFAYSNSERYDEKSRELEVFTTDWHKVRSLSDSELARQIYQDRIDILFDLSGHTAGNRLPVFALKPAPIQISWIGYPGTTGLTAMDYRIISNNYAEPGILDSQFTEKLMYMPFIRMFEPVRNCPEISPLPALTKGHFTFGSFNRLNKMNNEVYEQWAKILVALPSARMVIGAMDSLEVIDNIRNKLENFGVKKDQLIFRERSSMLKYLEMHNEIDILLDAFPYSGGTTTHHAAWMGVPTLTLAGKTMASRQGVAGVKTWGLDEFIAYSLEEYVQKAIAWSQDLERLNQIRGSMRERANGGQINRVITPATYFEQGLRKAWKIYCNGESAKSFSIKE